MSGKPSPSRLAAQYQTYPTASAAAVAALRGITNQKTETGGGILYNPDQGLYAATQPVGQSDGAHFAAAVGVPKGWQLNSTYHTHPAAGPISTQFSDNDISTAQQLKAPSYVLALADNKVRVFDPASSPISKNSPGSLVGGTRYALGSVVNETPPTPSPPETPAPAALTNNDAALTNNDAASAAATNNDAAPAAAASVPVTGSRITMKDFASRHRAQTTKYRHKIVHVKIKRGAP